MKHQELAAPTWRTFHTLRPAQWLGLLVGLVMLSLLALPARAADPVDPPDRAGRLSELNGQVWIYATDSNEWIAATRNRPVTSGDRISTENDGRAEVRIGSSVLRIAPNTELEVQALDDSRVSVLLHSGSATARLRTREAANEFSLATEEGRFRANGTGNYRFDRVDDTTSATALNGQLTYEHEGTALPVQPGQRVEFWRERGVPQYVTADPKRDAFGDWVAQRDAREERSVSTRYVSPEMTGVEDLDRYGRWEQTTEYGPIWTPREVVPGWAPYRMGHWAWVHPWGWTWVDDAPWGFAPFHYGRWVYHRSAWCWTPGRYAARPVYAPALVAWVGGPNVSVSVSVGRAPNVGWFPLGPREVYVPGYRVSPRYVRNVNVTHVTNITTVNTTTIINNPAQFMAGTRYVNRGLPQAVTIVPAGVVERRQPVAPAFRPVNDRDLRDMNRDRPRA
ncbi:MAG: FecR domain-containing protein, partial [Cytophagales bacterium]|nr:FecR domain-containing protein [Rhizobacter sp.]